MTDARETALARLREELAAERARADALAEALYPLVVGCLIADAREDAPEFVNGEAERGRDALPKCDRCGGCGALDGVEYVDVVIPEAVCCPVCEGWGFLKHALAAHDAARHDREQATTHDVNAAADADGAKAVKKWRECAEQLAAVLREAEYADNSAEEYTPTCPACDAWADHKPDCALVAALARFDSIRARTSTPSEGGSDD